MTEEASGGRSIVPSKKKQGKRTTRAAGKKKKRGSNRWIAYAGADGLERALACRLESLEQTNYDDNKVANEDADENDEEFFDEEDGGDSPPPTRGRRGQKRKTRGGGGGRGRGRGRKRKTKKKKDVVVSLRRFKSLDQVLLQDRTARSCTPSYVRAVTSRGGKTRDAPPRTFCAVTGHYPATYKDPQSGLRFSSVKAFRTITEHPPPWVHGSGNAPFLDALAFMRENPIGETEGEDDACTFLVR